MRRINNSKRIGILPYFKTIPSEKFETSKKGRTNMKRGKKSTPKFSRPSLLRQRKNFSSVKDEDTTVKQTTERKEEETMSNNSFDVIGNNVRFEEKGYTPLPDEAVTTVTYIGEEATAVTSQNTAGGKALSTTKKISGDEYVNTETGEVRKYRKNKSRTEDTASIKATLKKLRELILNNFKEYESYFVTLTYAEDMQDFNKAVSDFRKFMDKFPNAYKDFKIEYLRIIEPTENGNWHIHCLIKTNVYSEKFILRESDIQNCWKYGTVKAEQIYDVNGLANYFCTVHSDKNLHEPPFTKSKIKQMRWRYYPVGARIYSKSNGIKYPKKEKVLHRDLDEVLSDYNASKKSTLNVIDENTGVVVNRITYETFHKKEGSI